MKHPIQHLAPALDEIRLIEEGGMAESVEVVGRDAPEPATMLVIVEVVEDEFPATPAGFAALLLLGAIVARRARD